MLSRLIFRNHLCKNTFRHGYALGRTVSTEPLNKCVVLLKGLPLSANSDSLSAALASVQHVRKIEVEPGCAVHVVEEAEAEYAATQIRDTLNYSTSVKNTNLSSLVVRNLPSDLTSAKLQGIFNAYNPQVLRVNGMRSIRVLLSSPEEALRANQAVRALQLGGDSVMTHTSKLPDGAYCLQVSNIHPSASTQSAMETISQTVKAIFPNAAVSSVPGNSTTVTVRYQSSATHDKSSLEKSLEKLSFGNNKPVSTTIIDLKKPAIFLHGTNELSEEDLRKLCVENHNAELVQATYSENEARGDVAVAYFKSEADARTAITKIRSEPFKGVKIRATYREIVEPAVKIYGLPKDSTTFVVSHILSGISKVKINRIEILENSADGVVAVAVISNPKAATQLINRINKRPTGEFQLRAESMDLCDLGVEFHFEEGRVPTSNEIQNAISGHKGLTVKAVDVNSNITGYVAFDNLQKAYRCQSDMVRGKLSLDQDGTQSVGLIDSSPNIKVGGVMSSTVSVFPSFCVEVKNIPSNSPATHVIESVGPLVNVIKADRSAFVKFLRHKDVFLGGFSALKKMSYENVRLRPERYSALTDIGDENYDVEGPDEQFDRDSLKMLLDDYYDADPAIRYQVAKNYFERALHEALNSEDTAEIDYLLGEDTGIGAMTYAEGRVLLNQRKQLDATLESKLKANSLDYISQLDKNDADVVAYNEVTQKLFEMFLHRQDMKKFAHDFDDMSAVFGEGLEDDNYAWNQYEGETGEDMDRLNKDLRSFNNFHAEQKALKEKEKERKRAEKDARRGKVPIVDSEGKDRTTLSFDPATVMDFDGHSWSGLIINEDTTQKITPGGRIMSHRCLVMIGNLRGVGGYGMGKGETAALALESGFRDALNNLVYIDLYENAGLAHDVKGKYNNCYVYIRATPKDRVMVANQTVEAILNRLGITSVSCKVVGRRNPYAMVRALFRALEKHSNLDEIAKARGKRYLTLKWMYDQNL